VRAISLCLTIVAWLLVVIITRLGDAFLLFFFHLEQIHVARPLILIDFIKKQFHLGRVRI